VGGSLTSCLGRATTLTFHKHKYQNVAKQITKNKTSKNQSTCHNQNNWMLRFDKPVPGKDTDARTPESRALSVTWNGPS
jgi:hypothetical protein